jgi:hypothetical protein
MPVCRYAKPSSYTCTLSSVMEPKGFFCPKFSKVSALVCLLYLQYKVTMYYHIKPLYIEDFEERGLDKLFEVVLCLLYLLYKVTIYYYITSLYIEDF